MHLAAIDIGSNSIKLAIGEAEDGQIRIVETERVTLQMGRQVEADGCIGADMTQKVAKAVSKLATKARLAGARRIDVVGTSAAREARDGDRFAAAVSAAAGVPMRCLSGDEEAHLVSRSIEVAVGMPLREAVMVDIGGGSTEIVRCDGGLVVSRTSLPVGAVRLAHRFGLDGSTATTDAQRTKLDASIAEAMQDLQPGSPGIRAFGCGGTVSVAGRLLHFGMPPTGLGSSGADRMLIEPDQVQELRATLDAANLDERIELTGLKEKRATILPAGLAILDAVMKHLTIDELQVHEHGIRVGLLADLAER